MNRARIRVPLYTVAKTIKNAYSNGSFSSVTAATESLGLSDIGFKRPKKQLESSNILELGYQATCGGGMVVVPQMRALCAVIRLDHFKFASYGPDTMAVLGFT